jgi:hypothetical protein
MATLHTIREATLAARARTGDQNIGTQVARGLVDVVRAVPPASGRGRYTVTILRASATPKQAVEFLGAMQ